MVRRKTTSSFVEREKLLIEALTDGVVLVESLQSESLKLIAAFSLMKEGYIGLSSENPEQIGLTDIGHRTAVGCAVLRHS